MLDFQSVWRLIRPYQWWKNIFVFTGVLFGHGWVDLHLIFQAALAAIGFALVSSSIYVFNDIQDIEQDRRHPRKKNRPIAAGQISGKSAIWISLFLFYGGISIGAMVSWIVVATLITYIAMNICYSLWLKQVVILDVFCIATGFMLRILAGTFGLGIPPSKWLLLCGLLMTLFLGFSKRRADLLTRGVKTIYNPAILDQVIGISATGVIISYSLYTMSPDTVEVHHTQNLIYTVPVVIYGLFRYIYILHGKKGGGDPSRDLLMDRHMLGSIFLWLMITLWLIK